MKEHCWHSLGTGTTHGYGGHEEMVCCNCGASGVRSWHIKAEPVVGHGPYFKSKFRVNGPVRTEIRDCIRNMS